MSEQTIPAFNIIGISVRTTNENDQAATDIPQLWRKFRQEGILDKIPNKIDNTIYCVYTEYEKDYTKPYTTILGCKVEAIDVVPDGMISIQIENGVFQKHIAKGNLMQGAVYNEWTKIWNTQIERSYIADFEVYSEKAQNPENAEVDLFISVKS